MARMFGLSRTRAADLIAAGQVASTAPASAKSDRVLPGAMLDVTIPVEADPLEVVPEIVEGIQIIHDDDVDRGDRQAGRRRRAPLARLDRPDRGRSPRRRRASGSPPAAPPSGRGIVQRLDVGTSGVMVICKSEHAYSVLKNAFRHRDGRQDLPRAGAGPPRPARGHDRRPDRPAPEGRLQVRGHGRRPAQRHPLLDARGAPVRLACWRCTSRPGAPTRSGCTWPRSSTRASAT